MKLFKSNQEYICINGENVLKEEGKLSILESGYVYGLGVYETVLVLEGQILFWKKHKERLDKSIQKIGVRKERLEDLKNILKRLLILNRIKNGQARITVTRGEMEGLEGLEDEVKGNYMIMVKRIEDSYDGIIEKKYHLTMDMEYRVGKPVPSYMKLTALSTLYMIELMDIRKKGYDDGIFCNPHGYISEGTISNVFWVKGGRWYTPSLEVGILEGVTRGYIIEILKGAGKGIEEGFYEKEKIYNADEVLLTTSIKGIVKVRKIDGVEYRSEEETDWLIGEYRKVLEGEVKRSV